MHQNVRKNGTNIIINNTRFSRVRLIECLNWINFWSENIKLFGENGNKFKRKIFLAKENCVTNQLEISGYKTIFKNFSLYVKHYVIA